MKKFLLFFTVILFTNYSLNAQTVWQNTIGGSGADELVDLIKTSDGGYLLVGYSDSDISGDKTENRKGGADIWIVKTNSTGTVSWDKTLGGSGDDEPYSVIETQDGGYVIAGISDSNISGDKTENSKGAYFDMWIVKLNSTGTKIWDKTIGGSADDYASSVKETSTGDLVIGGGSESNISGDKTENSRGGYDNWIVKLNNFGTKIWDKTFGGSEDEDFEFLNLTPDGGYILGAYSESLTSGDKTQDLFGKKDNWIIKVSNTNTIDWQRDFGGSSNSYNEPTDALLTSDGGYLIAGDSDSGIGGNKTVGNKGSDDLWLIKLNNLGVVEWQKDIGGANDDEYPFLIEKPNGNFVISAVSKSDISGDKSENSYGFNGEIWLVEINSSSSILGDKTIGTTDTQYEGRIVLANDGNYVIASGVSSLSGDNTEAPVGSVDYWLFKLNQNTLSTPEISSNLKLDIYPVPATNELNISSQQKIDKATIFDVSGKHVFSITNPIDKIDISKLTNGIYVVKLFSEDGYCVKRFAKQ